MQITTVEFSTLLPPKDNPRRTLDTSLIAGLAQSIRADGLLQNLVVRPEGEGTYRIIAGKRRYLALKHLKKEGAIDDAYPVPVEIKDELSEADGLRLATVENLQREPLNPMDEAEAMAKLLQTGGTLDDITGKTGLSSKTVKRRLAVATLCSEGKKALRSGTITVNLAEALTLGSREQQRSVLASIESEGPPSAEEVREMFLEQKPTAAMAVFPLEQYQGGITTDLFSDEETTYFDDVDQFLVLQKAAIDALAEERRKTAAWVEVLQVYTVPWWQYEEAKAGEPSGIVIHLHPSGTVEVRDGLARHTVEEEVVEATRETPLAPKPARERSEFNPQLLRYVALQKSAAVQAALLRDPRKAREVATLLLLLGVRLDYGARLSFHPCLLAPEVERGSHRSYQEIEACTVELAQRLGMDPGEGPQANGLARLRSASGAHRLYEGLGGLSDGDLDRLMVLLPILCFGQDEQEGLDMGASLFNTVAVSLSMNMREWWTPDSTFLSTLRREQVMAVAAESGALERLQGLNDRSKKDAVDALSQYFAAASGPEAAMTEEGRKAREWLPGIFRFPAVKSLAPELPQT